MKLNPSLRKVNLVLVILLIVAMPNQIGLLVRVAEVNLPVSIADVLVALAFIGVALQAVSRRLRGLRLPPPQAFALVAAALIALLRTDGKVAAAKEVLQLVEYLLVAYAVFVNVAETSNLKPYLAAFAAGTAIVILWGTWQYVAAESALDVRAGFVRANRNLLGAFLALAVPVLYGIAVHARSWCTRAPLLVLCALGLMVNLAGGPLLATLVVLGVLSAIRGPRLAAAYALFVLLAFILGPAFLPRPYHSDTLVSSVGLRVGDNFLFSDRQLAERAQELLEPTKPIAMDKKGTTAIPVPSPLDARRLVGYLNDRRPLGKDEKALQLNIERAIAADEELQDAEDPLAEPQIARRYLRWNAALTCVRALYAKNPGHRPNKSAGILFGCGLQPYHEHIKAYLGERVMARTDEPEVFNTGAPEPFTHNLWLKTLVQTGLVGFLVLAWLVLGFAGRAVRLYRAAHSELVLGVALGAFGGILGFALGGLFTEGLVRGLAIPFVFVLAVIPLAERIVHGEATSPLEPPPYPD